MYLSYAYWAAHTFFSDIQTKDEVLIPPYSRVTLSVRGRVLCISLCLFRRLSLRSRSEVAGSMHESRARIQSDGWMDELRFYVLFNSISVISGRCLDDNERLCAMDSVYG